MTPLTPTEMPDTRDSERKVPATGAANMPDTGAALEQWSRMMHPFANKSPDGHEWKITEEEAEPMYEWTGSTYAGYRSFKGACKSDHKCGVDECLLQIWYQYELASQLCSHHTKPT